MITRIVQLPIGPENGAAFEAIFAAYQYQIKAAPGCTSVQLLKAAECYFTYSIWERQEDLDNYRHSDTFAEVWPKTKALFNGKPAAWSCEVKG